MLRVRALQLQRSSQPDFWERCARLSGLVAGTAGGRRQRPVHSRPLPYFIIKLCLSCVLKGCAHPSRRGDSSFSCTAPMKVGSALSCYITTDVVGVKCLNRGLRGFVDWWDCPALLSPFTLSLTLSHRGRGETTRALPPMDTRLMGMTGFSIR